MKYNYLGHSGLQVSEVGLGCMNFGMMNDAAESAEIVDKAIELGVNLFDTADVYGERGKSEEWLGQALGARRAEVVIATKFTGPMSAKRFDMQGGSRRYIIQPFVPSENLPDPDLRAGVRTPHTHLNILYERVRHVATDVRIRGDN